mgnify:CR=1 FL=1
MHITATTSRRPTRFVILIFSDGSKEEVCNDESKCVSTPKEQNMQLVGVEEKTQDAEENEEGVRDGPSDSFCSGGNEKGTFKQTDKEDTSGSNYDEGDVIETSTPNQAGTVSRK